MKNTCARQGLVLGSCLFVFSVGLSAQAESVGSGGAGFLVGASTNLVKEEVSYYPPGGIPSWQKAPTRIARVRQAGGGDGLGIGAFHHGRTDHTYVSGIVLGSMGILLPIGSLFGDISAGLTTHGLAAGGCDLHGSLAAAGGLIGHADLAHKEELSQYSYSDDEGGLNTPSFYVMGSARLRPGVRTGLICGLGERKENFISVSATATSPLKVDQMLAFGGNVTVAKGTFLGTFSVDAPNNPLGEQRSFDASLDLAVAQPGTARERFYGGLSAAISHRVDRGAREDQKEETVSAMSLQLMGGMAF